jgi:hypothetical protein
MIDKDKYQNDNINQKKEKEPSQRLLTKINIKKDKRTKIKMIDKDKHQNDNIDQKTRKTNEVKNG